MPVVNNWRSAHSYPLNSFQTNLRKRSQKVQAKPLVSQRLKRLDSVVRKLVRDQTSTMQLSQMQDIGGCRAVLASNKQVYAVTDSYRGGETKRWLHELVGAGKDYIASPKKDGYRSVHLIFKYVGPTKSPAWDNLKIEMQLRSAAQHSWATALEAVDIFTNQALKANRGDQNWQRFFALMGSFIAHSENCPMVPETPMSISELRDELRGLAYQLNVMQVLPGFGDAIQTAHSIAAPDARYYLLHLSFQERKISWKTFRYFESEIANAEYTELEKVNQDKPGQYVVLVKADSLSAMKRSYPGFFLDTGVFAGLVGKAIGSEIPERRAS